MVGSLGIEPRSDGLRVRYNCLYTTTLLILVGSLGVEPRVSLKVWDFKSHAFQPASPTAALFGGEGETRTLTPLGPLLLRQGRLPLHHFPVILWYQLLVSIQVQHAYQACTSPFGLAGNIFSMACYLGLGRLRRSNHRSFQLPTHLVQIHLET